MKIIKEVRVIYNKFLILVKETDNIILVQTEYGGHIGWYQGWNPNRWFVNKIVSFIDSVLRIKQNEEIENIKLRSTTCLRYNNKKFGEYKNIFDENDGNNNAKVIYPVLSIFD